MYYFSKSFTYIGLLSMASIAFSHLLSIDDSAASYTSAVVNLITRKLYLSPFISSTEHMADLSLS